MAKKTTESGVYRVTEIIGTSTTSWEDAAKKAVETASKSLRDLRVAEVSKLDVKIEKTIGIVAVAVLAASDASMPPAAITATCRRTSSAASTGSRSV